MKSISFSVSDLKYKLLSKSSLIRPYNIFSKNVFQDIKQFHKGEDLKTTFNSKFYCGRIGYLKTFSSHIPKLKKKKS